MSNKAPGTLLVIAMQPGCEAARAEDTLDAVELLVVRSRCEGYDIAYVEVTPTGHYCHTLPQLRRHTDNYPQVETVYVSDMGDDKPWKRVVDALVARGFNLDYVKVCGVNTSTLVAQIVGGMAAYMNTNVPAGRIEVVRKGCNDAKEPGRVYESRNRNVVVL